VLSTTLSVDRTDDGVQFSLAVENAGDDPVTLSFRSGMRADFAVRDGDEELWRWSEGRMFTQALGSETIEPGGRRSFGATWAEPEPGGYTAVGELAADDHDATAETEFSV
jgi:hypothetical protein